MGSYRALAAGQGVGSWSDGIGQPAVRERRPLGAAIRRHWQDLPERYGKWKTAHKRFSRWAAAGVWEKVFADLVEDRDNQYLMLDSTLVRAHQQATTGRGSGSKKGASIRLWGVPEAD